jgi:hypothetical protein
MIKGERHGGGEQLCAVGVNGDGVEGEEVRVFVDCDMYKLEDMDG